MLDVYLFFEVLARNSAIVVKESIGYEQVKAF